LRLMNISNLIASIFMVIGLLWDLWFFKTSLLQKDSKCRDVNNLDLLMFKKPKT
jgi:hypothetical protein